MRQTVEVKVSILRNEVDKLVTTLNAISNYQGLIMQKDFYFTCNKGELKMRSELIMGREICTWFHYEHSPGNYVRKFSSTYLDVDSTQAKNLIFMLTQSNGAPTKIEKYRKMWTAPNVIFYLDKIHGQFFFKVVVPISSGTEAQGRLIVNNMLHVFQFHESRFIGKSYSVMNFEERIVPLIHQ